MRALTIFRFIGNIPPLGVVLWGGLISLLWSYICLWLAAYFKRVGGLRTGYTRKIFHVLTFSTVVTIQMLWGLPAVCLFGAMASLVIGYAVVRGAGHPLYEALAREADAPHRTYYIIVPYFATLLGGVVSNLLFGPLSVIGYLVCGLGDAAGEPIGTRWGNHRYAVPGPGKVASMRSLEGSVGVLIVSLIVLFLGAAINPQIHFTPRLFLALPAIAASCAVVEAASPHGWDNITMQIVPATMAFILL
jgi:phytol kinase